MDKGYGAAWSLESALSKVGTGAFQWKMLLVCGLANASDAVEIMCVGLLGPAAEQDLGLTTKMLGVLNASIFVGMFIGGLSWGFLADTIGRRYALLLALLMNAAFGLLSASSTRLAHLAVLRMLAGVGVGGSMPVVFSQMSELCEASARGKFLTLVAGCWAFGSIYSALTGWLVITAAGWRWFVVVASLPAWTGAGLLLWLMPESPRWLAARGKLHLATQVLKEAAASNGKQLPPGFTLAAADTLASAPSTTASDTTDNSDHHEAEALLAKDTFSNDTALRSLSGSTNLDRACKHSRQLLHSISQQLRRAGGVLKVLLSPPLLSYTFPLAMAWVGMTGGWYCTMLWLPNYFKARGASSQSMYMDTLAVAAANIPGNLAALLIVERLGRRRTACLCMVGGCACALLFAAAPAQGAWPLAAACVFNAVSVGGWASLDAISAELYPTQVRSSGFGLLNATGRVSAFVTTYAAGALMQWRLWAPLLMTAMLLAAGSAALLVLPEPAGRPLEDVMPGQADPSSAGKCMRLEDVPSCQAARAPPAATLEC